MRPREREEEDPTPEQVPAPRIGGSLSSMVVRPSESGGGSDFEAGEVPALKRRRDSPPDPRRRDSPPDPRHRDSPLDPRRRDSPPPLHRRDSPPAFHRRGSPPPLHRRGSPPAFHRRDSPSAFSRRYSPPAFHRRGSPPNFHSRSQRFNENPGYGVRGGSISPPRRQKLDDSRYDPDFDHSVGPRVSRGFRGRGGGRFRDISPHHGLGRGGRPFGRGHNVPGRVLSPFEGEYVHRNDPNLSPREGDWICRNPSCGNLNFARRTHCNNCNQFRFGPEHNGFSRSPRRGYFNSPPPYGSPPRISGPPMDRGQRDVNGYRSPPRRLGVDDPRDFGTGSPPSRRGGRFSYHMRSERPEYREEEYRDRGKVDWPVHEEWDPRDRRRDDQRPRAPSPRARWVRDSRERSRSPLGDRPLKGSSYMGRGRGDRRYDDSYMGRVQGGDLDGARGRGFRQSDNSFIGQGRGDRPGMARGRKGVMY